MNRMTSRAEKFLVSFPSLNLSNSSKTVIGMATSCRLKFEIAEWSCNKTEVSRTNIFDFLAMDFSFKVIHPIHNPEKNQRELFTPHCQFL